MTKTRLIFQALIIISAAWALAQVPSSSKKAERCTIPPRLIQTGLVAEYRLIEESGTTIADYSGHGNTGIFGAGRAAPVWISTGSGGLVFSGEQQVLLPSVLTTKVKSIQIFLSFKTSNVNHTGYQAPLISTGDSGLGVGVIIEDAAITGYQQINYPHSYIVNTWSPTTGNRARSRGEFAGTGLISVTYDTTDRIYFNGSEDLYQVRGRSSGAAGAFQLGGGGAKSGASVDSHFYGNIYYVALYSTVLTPAQIAQNYCFIRHNLENRGVPVSMHDSTSVNTILTDGDSITSGGYPRFLAKFLNKRWMVENQGLNGAHLITDLLPYGVQDVDPAFAINAAHNLDILWAGTNDVALSGAAPSDAMNAIEQYSRTRRSAGWQLALNTMLDRVGWSVQKDSYNALIRQRWSRFADVLIDVASDPNLGCNGCANNPTYFTDGVHPSALANESIVAPLVSRVVNRIFGNTNWTSATTYNFGAPSPSVITAASESGNTVTFTSALTPPVGSVVTITGVIPEAYNTNDRNMCVTQTTSTTGFTCLNAISGLSAGSSLGRASMPLQKDEDMYTNLGGSSSGQTFTLEPCEGFTGSKIYIRNVGRGSWSVAAFGSNSIDGSQTIEVAPRALRVLQARLSTTPAPSCSWAVVR